MGATCERCGVAAPMTTDATAPHYCWVCAAKWGPRHEIEVELAALRAEIEGLERERDAEFARAERADAEVERLREAVKRAEEWLSDTEDDCCCVNEPEAKYVCQQCLILTDLRDALKEAP